MGKAGQTMDSNVKNNFNKALLDSKEASGILEYLVKFDLKKVIACMTMWPEVFVEWNNPSEEILAKHNGLKGTVDNSSPGSFNWLWSGVKVNNTKMVMLCGTQSSEIFFRLYKANAIYADGTYNEGLAETIFFLIQKEKK